MLTLEVTERVLATTSPAPAADGAAQNLGVVLSMDDFGTGWSSLLMLRSLPVDEVKLDRSFVSRAVDSDMDQAIVAKVAELAHALGLTVVAEGVETGQVLDRLAALGCDQAQGWHVARPMAADAVAAWSERWLSPLQRLRVDDAVPAAAAAFLTLGPLHLRRGYCPSIPSASRSSLRNRLTTPRLTAALLPEKYAIPLSRPRSA